MNRLGLLRKAGMPFNVLAVESSCDDTAVAIVSSSRRVLAQVIVNQQASHEPFQGIVPRLAAQLHRLALPGAINQCIQEAELPGGLHEIHAVAATRGPGLANCLSAGFLAGRSIASANQLPFYDVHHMEGHALTARLSNPSLEYPFLSLLISGGHTLLLMVHGVGNYTILGTTTDDSVGEALDKATRMLGIPWLPDQGPAAALEIVASLPNASKSKLLELPIPLETEQRKSLNFSFSGLKTALKYKIKELGGSAQIDEVKRAGLAFQFQHSAAKHLEDRLTRAIQMANQISAVVISGGVAKNRYIQNRLSSLISNQGLTPVFAPFQYCSDNAVMIGWAAIENVIAGRSPLNPSEHAEVKPDWPLDELKFCSRHARLQQAQ